MAASEAAPLRTSVEAKLSLVPRVEAFLGRISNGETVLDLNALAAGVQQPLLCSVDQRRSNTHALGLGIHC